jgi:hypothetical protein
VWTVIIQSLEMEKGFVFSEIKLLPHSTEQIRTFIGKMRKIHEGYAITKID